MAKASPSAGGLGALLGGGGTTIKTGAKSLPWWVKVPAILLGALTLYVLAGSIGALVITGGAGAYVIWSWYREKGNFVDSVFNWLFILGLLATVLRGPILKASDGVREMGPATTDAVTEQVRAMWPDAGLQVPQTVPPTTTAPIVLPPPAETPVMAATP